MKTIQTPILRFFLQIIFALLFMMSGKHVKHVMGERRLEP